MYLPKIKKKVRENPLMVQNSFRLLYAGGAALVFIAVVSAGFAVTKMQQRDRRAQRELRRNRPGQRVVIVGAGAAGCALASSLTSSSPDVHVTVIERDKMQTFMGLVPLAHVGHRSYDLNASGGIDFLRSPATWNVTKDADLVAGEVVQVLPDAQEVIVAPSVKTFAATTPTSDAKSSSAAGGEKTARVLPDGKEAYPYDILVLACGAERTLGSLSGILPGGTKRLDSFGIAVNPGVTRDELSQTFQGNVVHVKVPPKSFYTLMEAERADKRLRPPAVVLYDCGSDSTSAFAENGAYFAAMKQFAAVPEPDASTAVAGGRSWSDVLHPYMFTASRQHDGTFVSSTNAIWKYLKYFNKLSYCQLVAVTSDAVPLGMAPPEANNVILDFWRRRQEHSCVGLHHEDTPDGVHIVAVPSGSHEKTLVVELPDDASRTRASAAMTAAADRQPPATDRHTHFHTLLNAYPTAIDTAHQRVTLYNHVQNALITIPYKMLLLDLPLKAPAFVRHSGLSRDTFAKENAPASLQCTLGPSLSPGALTAHAGHGAGGRQLGGLSGGRSVWRWPWARKSASMPVAFEDESSFADVDPATLQHRRYDNIFALGDVAGLPTIKGYGAALAQVPVVSHNVRQMLYNVQARKRIAEAEQEYEQQLASYQSSSRAHHWWSSLLPGSRGPQKHEPEAKGMAATASQASSDNDSGSPPRPPSTSWFTPRKVNALYNGYTSFHVVMTTWRAMWPEMEYNEAEEASVMRAHLRAHGERSEPAAMAPPNVTAAPSEGSSLPAQSQCGEKREVANPLDDGLPSSDLARVMAHRNNHVWDNLAWRDPRGFFNAFYYQSAMYEIMYFMLFNRGAWYPPGWFSIPTFSVVDGSQQGSSRMGMGFL